MTNVVHISNLYPDNFAFVDKDSCRINCFTFSKRILESDCDFNTGWRLIEYAIMQSVNNKIDSLIYDNVLNEDRVGDTSGRRSGRTVTELCNLFMDCIRLWRDNGALMVYVVPYIEYFTHLIPEIKMICENLGITMKPVIKMGDGMRIRFNEFSNELMILSYKNNEVLEDRLRGEDFKIYLDHTVIEQHYDLPKHYFN